MKKPLRALAVQRLVWHGRTDRGRVRPNNEDAFLGLKFDAREAQLLGKLGEAELVDDNFAFAVSDGMGGARAGEFASRIALDKITKLLPHSFQPAKRQTAAAAERVLTELFRQVHRALKYLGDCYDECGQMEATLSLCWFTPGRMFFGHVGDSRIYHFSKATGGIKQLTQDDTYVGWLLREGRISEWEARTHPRRNVLQKALGGGNQFVNPQVGSVACAARDVFLLCTDGLTEGLYTHTLSDLLRMGAADGNPADRLVAAALAQDGRDNLTALVIEVR
jgi:protein phosphatase